MTIIAALAAGLALSALAYFAVSYVVFRAHSESEFASAIDEFYTSAQPLVDDDETPVSILRFIKFLNATVDDPKTARKLFLVATRLKLNVIALRSEAQERVIFFGRRNELEKPYNKMLVAWVAAVTSRSTIFGWAAQQALTDNVAKNAVSIVAEKRDCGIVPNGAMHGT